MKALVDSQVNALFEVKLIRGVDVFIVIGLLALVVADAIVFAAGHDRVALAIFLSTVLVLLLWIVLLVYRAAYLAISATAAVNLMTDNVARMVVSYQTGQPFTPNAPAKPSQ
jgi:hypothetical protein